MGIWFEVVLSALTLISTAFGIRSARKAGKEKERAEEYKLITDAVIEGVERFSRKSLHNEGVKAEIENRANASGATPALNTVLVEKGFRDPGKK